MVDPTDEAELSEIDKLRSRIHNMSDRLQSHESRLAVSEFIAENLTKRVDAFARTMATGEQLTNAVTQIELKLTNTKEKLESAVASLKDDLGPIKNGIYWIVTLIIGAVVLAIIATVIKKGP